MSPHPPATSTEGIGVEDLPMINRALFDLSVRAAADLHDPHREYEAFIEALWSQLAAAFDWRPQPWPAEVPPPD